MKTTTTKIYEVYDDGYQELKAVFVNSFSVKRNLINYINQCNGIHEFWKYKNVLGVKKSCHGAYIYRKEYSTLVARSKEA